MSATLIKEEQAVVEFKSLRIAMEERLRQLQTAQQTDEVRKAIRWLNGAMGSLCTGDENDNCGPTMVIPLTPR
jgi:hypothetical protein